jgi:hypothetical protein
MCNDGMHFFWSQTISAAEGFGPRDWKRHDKRRTILTRLSNEEKRSLKAQKKLSDQAIATARVKRREGLLLRRIGGNNWGGVFTDATENKRHEILQRLEDA